MDRVRLADDGTWTSGTDDGPDEECDASDGHDVGLDGKEVADFVDGEPNCGEGADPEDEERDPVSGGGAGGVMEALGDLFPVLYDVSTMV